ncbi:MAG: Deoxyribodipyrimidine photo-lyase [Bacteroidetes bacterium]|jgi:deoxyribodipyrimidine photo-lyase|nr:Deoxyribodipyrimidine photo-lyase [Bacteroidota bacterium]
MNNSEISKKDISIFWFRRDLRLEDNAGLYHALKNNKNVLPLFIFDTIIMEQLENKEDKRVEFILLVLKKLQEELAAVGSSLLIIKGNPLEVYKKLITEYSVKNVYTNHDYEPYAIARDQSTKKFLSENQINLQTFKDQVIFEKSEITKDDGKPYTVFSPYMRKWKSKLNNYYLKAYPTQKYFSNFFKTKPFPALTLKDIGFKPTGIRFHEPGINKEIIRTYDETRNIPAIEGTSRLSVHLRFGTISIRKLAQLGIAFNDQWLNELIWREFYMMILFHFPHAAKSSFKKQYDHIPWRNNEAEFDAWCKGQTGYPIVDAGMRELNTTGFMHNRVRMIVASFLVKHLLIDWRWGEVYFAEKLLDFDLSANNGGWQWAAGSGCDAAPYFRIFNPYEQTKRFDPEYKYIRKWVPEFEELNYLQPIVNHKFARERALSVYKMALNHEGAKSQSF